MYQVRQLSSTDRARTFALVLIATSLVALAGVAGYEIGTRAVPAHAAAAFAHAESGQDAPPVVGLQP